MDGMLHLDAMDDAIATMKRTATIAIIMEIDLTTIDITTNNTRRTAPSTKSIRISLPQQHTMACCKSNSALIGAVHLLDQILLNSV